MMTVRDSLFATTFAAAFCITAADAQLGTPTESRPVTATDIFGKKICWEDGTWSLYAVNGEFSNSRTRKPHSKWSVPQQGLIMTGDRQTQILPNGQFYSDFFNGRKGSITGHSEHRGTVCN
jgi:hypothetical protein